MAGTIDVGAVHDEMLTAEFAMSVGLAVLGGFVANFAATWMRDNVYDVSFAGGDSAYALLGGAMVLIAAPKKYGQPVAFGASIAAANMALRDFGVLGE